MSFVTSFIVLLQELNVVMTAPSFQNFLVIAYGWVFARRRTVTAMIQAAGAVGGKHHSVFHRFFAAARWSLDELGLAVFGLVRPWLDAPVFLALDDTLARKSGRRMFGAGMHHDPLISSRKLAVLNWGHSWVVLGVLVKLPFRSDRWFCLPILFRLYLNKSAAQRARRVYRTRPELAVEMLRWLATREKPLCFHLVADSLYGGKSVLGELPANCQLTSRLHLDARLYDAPRSGNQVNAARRASEESVWRRHATCFKTAPNACAWNCTAGESTSAWPKRWPARKRTSPGRCASWQSSRSLPRDDCRPSIRPARKRLPKRCWRGTRGGGPSNRPFRRQKVTWALNSPKAGPVARSSVRRPWACCFIA